MIVIFCYSGEPHPLAVSAVEKYAKQAKFIENIRLFDYNRAIASHWTAEEDLVVIEGDKEIGPDTLPSFEACSEPWCTYACETFPPPYTRVTTTGLACAKFSAECQMMISTDDFLRPDYPMREPCQDCGGRGCWRYLDTRIATAILNKCVAMAPHVHGRVKHHHEYPPDWAQRKGLVS